MTAKSLSDIAFINLCKLPGCISDKLRSIFFEILGHVENIHQLNILYRRE